MTRPHQILAFAVALVACDGIAGPKGPSATNAFVKATTTLSNPDVPTTRTLAAGEVSTFGILLRGYDPGVATSLQRPGYLLTTGRFDASVLITATEIGGAVRSDWVRFEVK